MDFSLSGPIDQVNESDNSTSEFSKCSLIMEDYLPSKIQKLGDQINYVTNDPFVECYPNCDINNIDNNNTLISYQLISDTSYQKIGNQTTNRNKIGKHKKSSIPFVQSQPVGQHYQNKTYRHKVGYWGPLLRYGTYGLYKKYADHVILKKTTSSDCRGRSDNRMVKETLKYPIELPFHIKMPRQAMICTLQSYLRYKLSDLRKLERDHVLHMGINYSLTLEQLTNQCGTCPKYLFTKVTSIPEIERQYFTSFSGKIEPKAYLSNDCSRLIEIKSVREFIACELYISDIIIAQGFALWKRRARETCARKAFSVLERPCYMVGSTRYWCNADYLTACVTEDLQTMTMLPPFLTDPTEPLFKKDENINKSDPNENFDILNPKSLDDLWLYAPTLLDKGKIKDLDPQILLYQSAEFSQMNISFEIETCFDESYTCIVLIDKSPAVTVEGLGSLEQARQAASLVLVDKLIDTQPIVVLKETYHDQYNAILREQLFHNNDFIVRSLLWSPDDICPPVSLETLSDIIQAESFDSTEQDRNITSKEIIVDVSVLTYFFNLYAQSSIVSCLLVQRDYHVSGDLWPLVPDTARLSGLLVLHCPGNSDSESVMICKQVPHRQLKASLFEKKEFGVFSLLSDGGLSEGYLTNLRGYGRGGGGGVEVCVDEDICDRPGHEKAECGDSDMSFRDIINDVHRDLIPGLDL